MTKRNLPPSSVRGFRVGDLVRTPLGRIAKITGCRVDELLDAKYVGCNPWTADVILQAHMLVKLDAHGNEVKTT